MAYTVQQHYLKYETFKLRAAQIRVAGDDWWIVLTFYSTLHLMQAYLVSQGMHPSKHQDRRDCIERRPELRPVKSDYKHLYNVSIDVRYNPVYRVPRHVETEVDEAFTALERDLVPRIQAFFATPPRAQP